MEVTAADLVLGARDYHPRFSEEAIPDAVALRQVKRLALSMVSTIAEENASIVSVPGVIENSAIEKALGKFHPLIPVDPYVTVIPSARIFVNPITEEEIPDGGADLRSFPVNIVHPEQQYPDIYSESLENFEPRVTVFLTDKGMVPLDLRRLGNATHGWQSYQGPLLYRYVPVPAHDQVWATPRTVIDLPAGIREALVVRLAQWMATRRSMREEAASFQGDYDNMIEQQIMFVQQQNVEVA